MGSACSRLLYSESRAKRGWVAVRRRRSRRSSWLALDSRAIASLRPALQSREVVVEKEEEVVVVEGRVAR
eukprot:scaffold886_cov174-Ochromonas_danica.AAC.11